jgi:isopentenyl-diphosphate delta-isomerase
MTELVVLVDEADREIGVAAKLDAHAGRLRHRAFSVLVFDRNWALLMQRRASNKYHSGGRWSNTCCGHPRPGEEIGAAARRRLTEEMGFDCPLLPAGTVAYSLDVAGGLWEVEFNHVFVGAFDGTPAPSPAEVSGWRWVDTRSIGASTFDDVPLTLWFAPVFEQAMKVVDGSILRC